jgi:general secretion pathway protein G
MRAPSARGFTLLEVLVVLALVAMAAAVVVPQLARRIDTINERLAVYSVTDQLRQLPRRVRLSGKPFELNDKSLSQTLSDGLLPLDLGGSEGLRLAANERTPLKIAANGTCKAAELKLLRGEAEQSAIVVASFLIEEITCAVKLKEPGSE